MKIDFDKTDKVGHSINDLAEEANSLLSSAKGIDASIFSSYSPGVVANNTEMCENISKLSSKIADFETSYTMSVQAYKDAFAEAKAKVNKVETPEKDKEVKQTPKVEQTTAEETKKIEEPKKETPSKETPKVETTSNGDSKVETASVKKIDTTGLVDLPIKNISVAKLTKEKKEELRATVDFYFNYPSQAKSVKEIKSDQLRELFEANGATLVGNNTYKMKVDGKTYSYNVASHVIAIEGATGVDANNELKCKFFARPDVTFEDVKSTLTLLSGSGEAEHSGYTLADDKSQVEVCKDTLVIVPYGSRNTPNIPNKVGACTIVGDFMVGGSKNINNTVVGYSLGGQAAWSAVSKNPGLYKNMVTVNSAAYSKSNGGVNFIDGNYDSFKDVNIYIFESENDDYITYVGRTIKELNAHGISSDNIHLYSNNNNLNNNARSKGYVSSKNIIDVDQQYAKSHVGWQSHSGGYGMLNQSGIFGYLTQ